MGIGDNVENAPSSAGCFDLTAVNASPNESEWSAPMAIQPLRYPIPVAVCRFPRIVSLLLSQQAPKGTETSSILCQF